jgi:cytochrome c oxidase subunit 4
MPDDATDDLLPETTEHPTTGRPLVVTVLVLIALTVISWAISRAHLGDLGIPIALLIAALKAGMVAWAFMELPRASAPARIMAFVTIAFIALLCGGMVGDLAMR